MCGTRVVRNGLSLKILLTEAGAKGSKILVTTRSRKVAKVMGVVEAYDLGELSEDDCWSLFKQRAFNQQGEKEEKPELVKIGKQIVSKCRGVALAAITLGGLLLDASEETWLEIRDSQLWELDSKHISEPEAKENFILNTLRLSYFHLPAVLKPCFAYCSLFPKDHVIDKETLIQLWMAQGFIIQSPQWIHKSMEGMGEENFRYLLGRCLFQDEQKDEEGNIISCKMHDLVHDLAQSVAGALVSVASLITMTKN
ncbi:PREDICTED: putative disease resistance protein RGA3 [Nelumbo nucifera]|uniref:Disease resistance protein RGA3 n=1 Tax=Nelumbo nucifera TaxID=4432 RepID=A0A1U8BPC0_NELNU|nr:PREDICTED: putative disease resistance protein RGA3 [Nelumbo nucifera]